MKKEIITKGYSEDEFMNLVRSAVRAELSKEAPAIETQTEPYITSSEVSKLIGVKVKTLYNLINDELIPYHKLPGKKAVLFKRSEIDAWIANGRSK